MFVIFRGSETTSLRVMLIFLLILDICSLFGCITSAVCSTQLPPWQLPLDFVTMINLSIILGTYGLTSLLCNGLTFYGLRKKNRIFLVPYLVFLPLVLTSLIILIIKNILTRGITPETLFIPMAVGFILTIVWLKLMRHWFVMSMMTSSSRGRSPDVEGFHGYQYSSTVFRTPRTPSTPDLPPPYENVVSVKDENKTETPPPCYEAVNEMK